MDDHPQYKKEEVDAEFKEESRTVVLPVLLVDTRMTLRSNLIPPRQVSLALVT